ncbi:hypothetical protein COCCADRAFT_86453 [Bipolaris zeicola 26-R-13]|uniref:Uncharacterized protein n=1 Tax=Cochliobolus carbonum (strain 26-R-13) TaxID=930089 RepID=W6Z082_COCC2|nr:uncharacterized protein COCCADRAFT_86453 [Bipolaris zeicola 26-R-13]EUC37096.1 hypothetical protein COCCADRAFT_86453 [Bipolaris zeicola 26-R-13]
MFGGVSSSPSSPLFFFLRPCERGRKGGKKHHEAHDQVYVYTSLNFAVWRFILLAASILLVFLPVPRDSW